MARIRSVPWTWLCSALPARWCSLVLVTSKLATHDTGRVIIHVQQLPCIVHVHRNQA